jgi:hypothetical protein
LVVVQSALELIGLEANSSKSNCQQYTLSEVKPRASRVRFLLSV